MAAANQELISVILPVYNVEAYLRRCIDSILKQTYTEFEVLMIDDGSTDNSGMICDEYCALDHRCKVIHQENRGLSGARNTGLRKALGEYIAFIDSDDYIHPCYLEYLHRAINEGDYQMSITLYDVYWLKSGVAISPPEVQYSSMVVSRDKLLYGMFCNDIAESLPKGLSCCAAWGRLYRRELLDGLFFVDVISEDYDYNHRAYLRMEQSAVVLARMYYWCKRTDSLSFNPPQSKITSFFTCDLLGLEIVPESMSEGRGDCLLRLYKKILSIRYMTERNHVYQAYLPAFRPVLKKVAKDYIREFVSCRNIPLVTRFGLILFYYIPQSYTLFRWIMEMKTALTSVK